jgi:hypothetical protein
MGTKEKTMIFAAVIAAVGAIIAACIPVILPRLIPTQTYISQLTTTTASIETSAQFGSLPSSQTVPSFPQTADEAATVFGVSNNAALLYRAAQGLGWATNNSVRLKIYTGNCIDMPKGASTSALQAETDWIYTGLDHDRALVIGDGYVSGPATIYWGACPKA